MSVQYYSKVHKKMTNVISFKKIYTLMGNKRYIGLKHVKIRGFQP